MSWPKPFSRRNTRTRTAFGYTFQLTEHHLTPDHMDPMKQSYDMLGERALGILDSMSPQSRSALTRQSVGKETTPTCDSHSAGDKPPESKRDLYVLLQQNVSNDAALSQLWAEANHVPSWVCWDQIARGQDCFYRYGGPILNGLAFQSLLGGMVKSFALST